MVDNDLSNMIDKILDALVAYGIEDYSVILACRTNIDSGIYAEEHIWHMTPLYLHPKFDMELMRQSAAIGAKHVKIIERNVNHPYIARRMDLPVLTIGVSKDNADILKRKFRSQSLRAFHSFYVSANWLNRDMDVEWLYIYYE